MKRSSLFFPVLAALALSFPRPAASQSASHAGADSVRILAAPDSTAKVSQENIAKAKPFEQAVVADSLNPQKHFALGNTYYDQGRLNEALAQFNRVVQLDSTFWKGWVNI